MGPYTHSGREACAARPADFRERRERRERQEHDDGSGEETTAETYALCAVLCRRAPRNAARSPGYFTLHWEGWYYGREFNPRPWHQLKP